MTVRCLDCQHMTIRPHPGTVEQRSRKAAAEITTQRGFVRCLRGDHYRFLSPVQQRDCHRFAKADAELIARREAWMAKPRDKSTTEQPEEAQA